MIIKKLNSRIQHKIDSYENWSNVPDFIPFYGEIIIYELNNNNPTRIKIGNGVDKIIDLPFIYEEQETFLGLGKVSLSADGDFLMTSSSSFNDFQTAILKNQLVLFKLDISDLGGTYAIATLAVVNEDSLIFNLSFNDGSKNNLFTIILTNTDNLLLITDVVMTETNFETWWNTAENKYVDSTSKNSFLPITEGAVWESFQRFTQLYEIQCNITLSNGIITSVELGYNGGKDLLTILTEAADAYHKSRGILLVDFSKGIYLNGLMAVETLQNASSDQNSYKFIFDASHEEINVKNIIHLDANGFTCYHATLQSSLDIKNSLIKDETNPVSSGAVYSAIQDTRTYAENLANGRCKTYVFDDKATLQAWIETLDTETLEELNSGDVFLLRSVGEPDYWWEPVGEVALLAAYSDEDIVVDGKGVARILETTKVDFSILNDYAHKQNDLDGLIFKRVYEYNSGASYANGTLEYDTVNKKLYKWSNGVRQEETIDENTIYIVKEV